MKKPFQSRILRLLASILILLVFSAGAGILLLSRNLAPLARWTFEKNLPDSKIDVQEVQMTGPGEISFTNFVIKLCGP